MAPQKKISVPVILYHQIHWYRGQETPSIFLRVLRLRSYQYLMIHHVVRQILSGSSVVCCVPCPRDIIPRIHIDVTTGKHPESMD